MKVTWIAYSERLNPGKYAALVEQAGRLGRVRSEVWQRYGSMRGVGSGLTGRQVRDRWLADGTHGRFGVRVNAAINILQRAGDPDIALHTPHHTVKQILQDRADRHRTRLPVQDSSPTNLGRRANYPDCSAMSKK